MPPKLKVLSGSDLIKIFSQFGFEIHSQKGSHIKLKRLFQKQNQTLTIPNHKELDRGTLKAIIRQASRYIPEDQLFKEFHSESK